MEGRFSQPGVSRQEEVRIGSFSRIRSVPFFGLLVLGLLASGAVGVLAPSARFLLAFSIVSWLPGVTLVRWLLRDSTSGPLELTALSFAAGVSWTSFLTWLATIAGISYAVYAAGIQWSLAALFLVGIVRHRPQRATAGDTRGQGAVRVAALNRSPQWTLVVAAVVLAAVTAVKAPPVEFEGDALDHIGYVREIQSENSLTPNGVLAPRIMPNGEPNAVKSDPRKGTLHPIVALAASVADVDPIVAWQALPAFLFPISLLAFTWFCVAFVPRKSLVFACALLFLLFQGGVGFLYGKEASNGQNLALLFYWIMVPLALRYAFAGGGKLMLAMGLVFAGGAMMHVGVVIHVAILLATLLIFHRWLDVRPKTVVKMCAGGAAIAIVVVAWKYVLAVSAGNAIHVHPQGVLYFGEKMYAASPFEILRKHGLVFLGGLMMIPFLILGAKRWYYARLHISFAAIPYMMCFVPFLTPLIYERATYMTFRSLLNVPVFAAIVVAFYGAAMWARRRGLASKAGTAAVLLIWSHVFLSPSIDAVARAASEQPQSSETTLFERYKDLLRFLSTRPAESVVLSDPMTSYLVSAATDHRVVAVQGQHGNPNDPDAFDRLKAVRDVLSPFEMLSKSAAACDRYGADFIVVNGRLRESETDYMVDWSRRLFGRTTAKLASADKTFRALFETEDIVVYLYYPGTMSRDQWVPDAPPMEFGLGELQWCDATAPDGSFRISGAAIEPSVVLPGETVTITLSYDKEDFSEYDLPVVIYIRFDHESIAKTKRAYPGEKQVRRARERRNGRLLRYRVNHTPFGGVVTPDQFPVAATFYETIPVKLPSNLELGTYVVEFRIARDTLLPNFTVRDMLFNRDQYSGTGCLVLDVTRQVVR